MGFIQVPPDSTGKLVDTTIVAGQHRENICIGDPTTPPGASGSAGLTDVLQINAPQAQVDINGSQLPFYGLLAAVSDGAMARMPLSDPMGRARVNNGGDQLEDILTELRRIAYLINLLLEPGVPIADLVALPAWEKT